MTPDDPRPEEDRALLEGLTVHAPPAGFAERVTEAWQRERASGDAEPALPSRRPSRLRRAARFGLAAGLAAAVALAAEQTLVMPTAGFAEATTRLEVAIGGRAVAALEPGAALAWDVGLLGDARVEQERGRAFYRVDRGGPFVVHTPAGEVHVTGTCFSVEVDQMSSEAAFLRSTTKGALTSALATALVIVTVHEGRVVLGGPTHEVELELGQRARLVVGQAPERLPDASVDERATRGDDERALQEQVAELEARLKTLAKAQASGQDPVLAENRRLQAQVAKLKEELLVEQQLREEREGGAPIPFPDDLPDAYREQALVKALRAALSAVGLEGEIGAVDCSEYPCIVFGQFELPPGDEDVGAAWKRLEAQLQKSYAPASHDYSIRSSTFRDVNREGQAEARNRFGFSVYPKDSVDEAERAAMSKRLRFRNNQYFDATWGAP